MNMYEPIITLYEKASRELEQRKEDAVLAAIAEIGVQVNKDELIRALKFDRDQYNKGFADGVKEGSPTWISVEERLPENWKERVLVKVSDPELIFGNQAIDTDRYFNGAWVRYGNWVSDWMPLSEPPEEDAQ